MGSSSRMPSISTPHGTARVIAFARSGRCSILAVQPPIGPTVVRRVRELPDPKGADQLATAGSRVLSVQFCQSPVGRTSYVFMTSASGAKRVEVSQAVALALCERGVRGTWVGPVQGHSERSTNGRAGRDRA